MTTAAPISGLLAASPLVPEGPAGFPIAEDGLGFYALILWLPAISMVLCGVCAALRVKSKLPAWITVGCLGASFGLTVGL